MMVEENTVVHIARLAHLEIRPEQISKYTKDLGNILDMVKALEEVNTDNIEPMTHPLSQAQRMREDRVTENDERKTLQETAPAIAAGMYLVPQVIE
ncbi:MAG: aspartyl/glutamyl-tRNA(Asn/Gln) amidotransferase subunit [Gammaproteobacteria bacterium]|jgi:aspartyl-tRNA(Asn)/glutamyl-tRNA(Gln) amidotransferase subunit C|nr:aspartyl/glutamyl-tRNA(Asn/Gln) amidotransferase subunit [Gammaproteobacteria bacterium]